MTSVFTGDVLIVEDNFIIAMNTEELVTELGAALVHLASMRNQALSAIRTADITAAILDFNLENGISATVADALHERGIPFVLRRATAIYRFSRSTIRNNPC